MMLLPAPVGSKITESTPRNALWTASSCPSLNSLFLKIVRKNDCKGCFRLDESRCFVDARFAW